MCKSVQAVQDAVQDETGHPAQLFINKYNRIGMPVQQCRGFTRARIWKKISNTVMGTKLRSVIKVKNFPARGDEKHLHCCTALVNI